MSNSKSEAMHLHFRRRCVQRVGRELDENQIVKSIKAQKLEFIERKSNRVTIFALPVDGKKFRVAYDKLRHQCITIMPEEFFSEEAKRQHIRNYKDVDIVSATQRIMNQYGLSWEKAREFLESL